MKKKHYIFLSLTILIVLGYFLVQKFPFYTEITTSNTEEVNNVSQEKVLGDTLVKTSTSTQEAVPLIPQKSVPKNTQATSLNSNNKTSLDSQSDQTPLVSNTKPVVEKQQFFISKLEQDSILQAHNFARTSVGVAPLIWSATLAQGAGEWATVLAKEGCSIRHASSVVRKGAGENIWYGSGYDVWNVTQMVNDWISEKKDYSYETNECTPSAVCGHYTQIVWDKTTAVGCGMAACSGERVFVCRYTPAGNIIGQKPY